MICLTFFDWIGKQVENKVPFFIPFLWGLLVGVIGFILFILIMFLITRSKKFINKINPLSKPVEIKEEYKEIINKQKELFTSEYKGIDIKKKISGLEIIASNLLTDISKLYYPESSDPIFEVSIDQLVDLTNYIIHRINFTLDRLLDGKLKIVNTFTMNSIKDKRISSFFKQKEETQEVSPKKESKIKSFFVKKAKNIGLKIGLNMADKEILLLIDDIGEDINKVYSKQPLVFTDTLHPTKKVDIKIEDLVESEEDD